MEGTGTGTEVLGLLVEMQRDVRELLKASRQLRGVREWWLKQESDRARQTKHRTSKKEHAIEEEEDRRTRTTRNDPGHSLMNSVATISLTKPSLQAAMMSHMESFSASPSNSFRMEAALNPRRALVLLFSLYNSSFWRPWVTRSGNTVKVFRDWAGASAGAKATNKILPAGQVLPKVNPPCQWTDSSITAFCECWFWKVTTVVYRFVNELIDLEDEDVTSFREYMDLCSQFSEYEVLSGHYWSPEDLYTWKRGIALKAYRKVCPRLKVLRSAFEEGITLDYGTLLKG